MLALLALQETIINSKSLASVDVLIEVLLKVI